MSVAIVLGVFGVLYVALALWCYLAPETVSQAVGFSLQGGSGKSEFLVVYGGLELAMGVFFLIGAWSPDFARGALLFALVSSACLAATRCVTLLLFRDVASTTRMLFATEVLLTVVAGFTWFGSRGA